MCMSDLLPALVPERMWQPVGDEPALPECECHAWTYAVWFEEEEQARRRCHVCHRHDYCPMEAVTARLLAAV